MCVCGCTQLETRVAVVLPSIAHPARGLSMNSSHSCHTCAHMQESGMSERNDGGRREGGVSCSLKCCLTTNRAAEGSIDCSHIKVKP